MLREIDNEKLTAFILKTLLYFDIFRYPLLNKEVFQFINADGVSEEELNAELKNLAAKNLITHCDGFFGIDIDRTVVERRIKGNAEAKKCLPLVKLQGQFIATFPFVRAVLASGSMSKNYMDENSDFDFFIVTAPRRLWIARTLLVIYKRLFLSNSHKQFCVNYFIDEEHLEIEEKNLFTATELATVLPLYNVSLYVKLIEANPWLLNVFPNFKPRDGFSEKLTTPIAKRFFEFILNVIAKPLDFILMRITLSRWKRIYGNKYNKEDFAVAFKSEKYASKNHPRHFQRKVMDRFSMKLQDFNRKHNMHLQHD